MLEVEHICCPLKHPALTFMRSSYTTCGAWSMHAVMMVSTSQTSTCSMIKHAALVVTLLRYMFGASCTRPGAPGKTQL